MKPKSYCIKQKKRQSRSRLMKMKKRDYQFELHDICTVLRLGAGLNGGVLVAHHGIAIVPHSSREVELQVFSRLESAIARVYENWGWYKEEEASSSIGQSWRDWFDWKGFRSPICRQLDPIRLTWHSTVKLMICVIKNDI